MNLLVLVRLSFIVFYFYFSFRSIGKSDVTFVHLRRMYSDVEVLRACDGIISLPTYGIKNSLNVANCVSVVIWDTLRRWHGEKQHAT